ncbi:hypothetical protein K466DRAFT_606018 [Polyporus arcularius HHB13444]|uniref:Uncharacterized protein n=1 Tax=Polyporus arcularius HHB13444 TaxID=1314778 RepID=A0A5C3NQF5_9APHY|nr:hypothetical protein K466DRAFT_606018 [Polyporus arcularius HHB13444]
MHITQDDYHMSGGGKDTDEDDKALSENAGVFVHQGDWAKVFEHASKNKCKDREQMTCSNFGAMGIVTVLCRHRFVLLGGIIDLNSREKFVYVDLAFKCPSPKSSATGEGSDAEDTPERGPEGAGKPPKHPSAKASAAAASTRA